MPYVKFESDPNIAANAVKTPGQPQLESGEISLMSKRLVLSRLVSQGNGIKGKMSRLSSISLYFIAAMVTISLFTSDLLACEVGQTNPKLNCDSDFSTLYKAANTGDKRAQFRLGLAYEKGRGVAKNTIEAVEWYEKASNQNELDARHNLALMYKAGRGVKKDLKKAFELERTAAELGHKYAQNGLGLAYLQGYWGDKNIGLAIKWLTKSAENGLVEAQSNLGHLYENGDGVPVDYEKSFQWYQKAANSGDSDAQFSIGNMYQKGLAVKKSDKLALYLV